MTTALTTNATRTTQLLRLLPMVALAVIIGTMAASPARADWDDRKGHGGEWHERGWDDHSHRAYGWYHAHPHYAPAYVYAPPPVVYYPPESPGINLIVPLHFH